MTVAVFDLSPLTQTTANVSYSAVFSLSVKKCIRHALYQTPCLSGWQRILLHFFIYIPGVLMSLSFSSDERSFHTVGAD